MNNSNQDNAKLMKKLEQDTLNGEKTISSQEQKNLNTRILELEATLVGLQRINSSLAHLTIDETYKNFYDWKVKPAIDIIALLSSSASNVAHVADMYANNVYAKKHEVKKALKMSERLLDEVEKGLDLFDIEMKCLLESNGSVNPCKK